MSELPDTIDDVAVALLRDFDFPAAVQGGEAALSAARIAIEADRKTLADAGYQIVKVAQRYESKTYNGGTAHGVVIMRDDPFTLIRLTTEGDEQ